MLNNGCFEYSFDALNDTLIKIFESRNIAIVEECFDNHNLFKIYCDEDLDALFLNSGVSFRKRDIKEINWLEEWKNFLKPGLLCERIAFKNDVDITFDNLNEIYIKPSLAFGTGSHPTTHIAASLLENICKNQIILDVGTGSGILSILAEKLGAKKIYACEIDKNAISNIKENIRNNNCKNIDVYIGSIEENYKKIKCNIIVANILCDTLIYLWNYFIDIAPYYIILSGFYKDDLINFLSSVKLRNYKINTLLYRDNWWGINFAISSDR
jgi:ribosomal protein L11 methyltransferase